MGIKFEFAGGESLGVRSMAMFIETPDLRILLDAGAALGMRAGLLPHPLEYKVLKETKERIRKFAEKSDYLTISHYHFDHYIATWKEVDAKWTWSSYEEAIEVYGGKTIFAKAFRKNINISQRKRGYLFGKISKDFCKEIIYADDSKHQFGRTTVVFSAPLHHGGDDTKLGYVIGTSISYDGKTIMHCADVQGPGSVDALRVILEMKPDILVLSGPPLYLAGWKIDQEIIDNGLRNLEKIVENVKHVIVDHHLLRNVDGLDVIEKLKNKAKKEGNKVSTIAETMGIKNNLLEAKRKQLYDEFPPDEDFKKWLRLRPSKQMVTLPPV